MNDPNDTRSETHNEFVFDPSDDASTGGLSDIQSRMDAVPTSRRGFMHNAAKVGAGAVALGVAGSGTAAAAHADEPYSDSPYEDNNPNGYGALTDVEIVRFALLLERLEATFYTQAVGMGKIGESNGGRFNIGLDIAESKRDILSDIFGDDVFGNGAGGSGRLSELEIETSGAALQFAAEPSLRNATFEYFQRIRNHEQAHVTALENILAEVGANPDFASNIEFTFPYDTADEFIDLAQTFEDTGAGAYTAAAPAIDTEKYLASAAQILAVEARHASYLRVLTTQSQVPFPRAFQQPLSVKTVVQRVLPFVKGVDKVSEVVALVQTGESDPSG